MSSVKVTERVERVAATCRAQTADRQSVMSALEDLARIESWAAARRAELVSRLSDVPGSFPEADIADTSRCSLNAAVRETERAATLSAATAFAGALEDGDIRPGHVDALTRVVKNLDAERTSRLIDQQQCLVAAAATSSIRAFEHHVKRAAKALEIDADADERLARQRRATRLKHWIDTGDGMWCVSGRFDPRTGSHLARAIDDAVTALFAETTPDTAPDDRLERHHHLNALALVRLVHGDGPERPRPGDPIVVVDATTASTTSAGVQASQPELDWGLPIELPVSVLADVFQTADPDVIIVANGVIVHAPGRLDLGRTTRLANRAQRRALRGLYATCAIPGCSVHFNRCKLHHVVWWRHGGRTDLDNLLPVCAHHHTRLHNDPWKLTLGAHRELTVELRDGNVLTSGRPKRSAA